MRRVMAAVVVGVLAAGCAPGLYGQQAWTSDDLVARVVVGETSREEIIQWFGPPSSVHQFSQEGIGTWMTTGHRVAGQIMFFTFDEGGVVRSLSRSTVAPWPLYPGVHRP